MTLGHEHKLGPLPASFKIHHGVRVEVIDGEVHYIDTQTHDVWRMTNNKIKTKGLLPIDNPDGGPTRLVKHAISLTGLFCSAHYHFPVDYLWWLLQYDISNKDLPGYKLLLSPKSSITDFQTQWLNIMFPQIPVENYIYMDPGITVGCLNLLLPGRTLGRDTYMYRFTRDNLRHIRDRITNRLDLHPQERDTMLLIKRNRNRELVNWYDVQESCLAFCDKYNLKLDVFDDNNVGPVSEQLKRFHKARVVIGCHGAGNTNIITCQPDTILIEFKLINRFGNSDPDLGSDEPHMYRYLSNQLNMEYYYLTKSIDQGVDIGKLDKLLEILHIT